VNPEPSLESVSIDLQSLWTLLCAALVLFMQAGFCCLEAGSVRQKNSINVAVKNVVDLCISFPAFFVIGYALMFGSDWFGLVGTPVPLLMNLDSGELTGFLYQAAFCATAATIVSGGVAERCRFMPYLMVSAGVSLIIYPLFGHWVWGGGFLGRIGYHDFAGSSVVHIVGAGVTLAGVQVLGPRQGRFAPDGRSLPIPPSSMPMVALGVMILMLGWIGFNGGSAPLGRSTPEIVTCTLLAACFGGTGAMLLGWALRGLAQVDLVFNGLLGGLVAITAGADAVGIQAASAIGFLGGLSVVLGSWALERLELDDAVGAVPVHGVAGAVGILATGLFARSSVLAALDLDRFEFVAVQCLGLCVCLAWSYYGGWVLWNAIGAFTQLRVGELEERLGMNFSEHQLPVSHGDPFATEPSGLRAAMAEAAASPAERGAARGERGGLGGLEAARAPLAGVPDVG